MSLAEAVEMAKKVRIDGKGLYEMRAEQWMEKYDIQGQTIYNELQQSKFGEVCVLLLVSCFP